MKLQLYYPVKPYFLNQGFGLNPDYYARFNMKAHNGNDLMASHGQPVYSPCDGMASYYVDKFKGDGIYIKTTEEFDYKLSSCYFRVVLWHLCPAEDPQFPIKIPKEGMTMVKTGQLLGYADNTGAPYESTGDHLHVGLYPELIDGTELEAGNGFNGSIDPQPYFNGLYAEDVATAEAMVQDLTKITDTISAEPTLRFNPAILEILNNIWTALKDFVKKVANIKII